MASADDALTSATRKDDHLRVVLSGEVAHVGITTGLSDVRLAARALPELDLDTVGLHTHAFGRDLRAPLLISCMTGGTTSAGAVNRSLAVAAQATGVALGLGSGRVLLEGGDPTSFQVRDVAPDVLLLANLGAVQLPTYRLAGCEDLVGRTDADVLVLHLNAVQEAVQPGGDTEFAGLTAQIAEVAAGLSVPVVVKEVGFGLAPADIDRLVEAGVAGIDVAGAGGTNWATVEGRRDTEAGMVAAAFADWGWSTVDSLRAAVARRGAARSPLLIASGGIRDGVEAAKCLCLGADLVGFGTRLIGPAAEGPDAASRHLGVLVRQLRVATWAVGAASTDELGAAHLVGRA